MKEAAMEPNADEFVGFYVRQIIPPRNEEKLPEHYKTEITDSQRHIYELLVQSSEQFNNSEATYTLQLIHL